MLLSTFSPLSEIGEESTKLYVICQGSAKEWIGKSNYEIQKELKEQQQKPAQTLPIPIIQTETEEPCDSSPESVKRSPGRRTMKNQFSKDLKSKKSQTQTLEKQKAFVDSVLRKSSKFATALVNLKTVIALNSAFSSHKPATNVQTFRRGALKGMDAVFSNHYFMRY